MYILILFCLLFFGLVCIVGLCSTSIQLVRLKELEAYLKNLRGSDKYAYLDTDIKATLVQLRKDIFCRKKVEELIVYSGTHWRDVGKSYTSTEKV